MDEVESRSVKHKFALASQICLRLLAIIASVVAASIMMTNKQSAVVYGLSLDAKYTYAPAFEFFAAANIVAAVLSIFSLPVAAVLVCKSSNPSYFFYMFLHDLAITILMTAACAAAITFGAVGKHGNSHIGWIGICDHFPRFCDRATLSIVFSIICFVIYLILTVVSANRARNNQA